MTQEHEEDEVCEKTEGWDEEDVGKRIVKRVTPNGTYFNELIVSVFAPCAGVVHWTVPRPVDSSAAMNASTLGNLVK